MTRNVLTVACMNKLETNNFESSLKQITCHFLSLLKILFWNVCRHLNKLKQIYWAPQKTIHSIYLKLFDSKNETLTHVVRKCNSGRINTQFFYKLWISDKRCWCWPTISYVEVNLQNNTSTIGSLFLPLNPLWKKTLEKLINFKLQMYHTLIVQNVETWTWRHFRSNADCVPPLLSIEMHNPF